MPAAFGTGIQGKYEGKGGFIFMNRLFCIVRNRIIRRMFCVGRWATLFLYKFFYY